MIVFGSKKNLVLNEKVNKFVEEDSMNIFNLFSIVEKGDKLHGLIPPFPASFYDSEDEKQFDIAYASYILGDDKAFLDLMKIVYPEYEKSSENVLSYILIDEDEIRTTILESLIKLIQERYGLSCNIIHEPEDWETVESSEFDITGLYNIDQDKERYSLLIGDKIEVSEEE